MEITETFNASQSTGHHALKTMDHIPAKRLARNFYSLNTLHDFETWVCKIKGDSIDFCNTPHFLGGLPAQETFART